jgi:fatty acid elongase 3
MQITQFVIDLFAVYFASKQACFFLSPRCTETGILAYSHFAYLKGFPTIGDCSGGVPAAIYGCALLTFYLVLFIDFYRRTYNASSKNSKSHATNGKSIANGNGM